MDALTRRIASYMEQIRAKYDTEELKELLDKGEAFKNENGDPSFPIVDSDDLENAIRAVGRAGADHDAVRKYVIGRAKALGLDKDVPDNWNADGSLADEEKAAAWDAQHRSGPSYGDLMSMLENAVAAKYVDTDDDWSYVRDFTDSVVVWCLNGETFQSDYTVDGDDVKLSNKTLVRTVTTYVPMESNSQDPRGEAREGGYRPTMYSPQSTETVQCPDCGLMNAKDAKYCDQCGFQLEGSQIGDVEDYQASPYLRQADEDVWCPGCTKCNSADACYCDQCGQRLVGNLTVTLGSTEEMPSNESAGRSGLLAIPKRAFTAFTEQPPSQDAQIQVRVGSTDADTNLASFLGYASTTNVRYGVNDWMGEYGEQIAPGAFAKTLREQGAVPLLFNHDGLPVASTSSGTSVLSEDKLGLRNEAMLDRRQGITNDLCIAMERGDVNKMSFSFQAIKDEWNSDYDERSVNELRLFDTSVVTYPANPTTTAELRDAMRSTLGREGMSLIWSTRSAVQTVHARGILPVDAEPVVEKTLRALFAADEEMCRVYGRHGRARTFLVARTLQELRTGRVLSSGNESLLRQALDSLNDVADSINTVIASNNTDPAENSGNDNGDENDEGMDYSGDMGGSGSPGSTNPMMPQDGLGPRVGNTGPRSDRTPESVKRAIAKIKAARDLA